MIFFCNSKHLVMYYFFALVILINNFVRSDPYQVQYILFMNVFWLNHTRQIHSLLKTSWKEHSELRNLIKENSFICWNQILTNGLRRSTYGTKFSGELIIFISDGLFLFHLFAIFVFVLVFWNNCALILIGLFEIKSIETYVLELFFVKIFEYDTALSSTRNKNVWKNNRKLTQIPIKVLRNKFWTSNPTDIKNCVYISF